jgi:hypothetical protein
MTSQEKVPWFSLRRGARFLETFRAEEHPEGGDDDWLAGLRPEEGPDAVTDGVGHDDDPDGHPDDDALDQVGEGELLQPVPSDAQPEPPLESEGGLEWESGLESRAGLEPLAMLDTDPEPVAEGKGEPAVEEAPIPFARPTLEPVPGLADAMATLAERLSVLEEALAKAAAACTVTRLVLGHGQSLLDHPSNSTDQAEPSEPDSGDEALGEEGEIVELRERPAPTSAIPPVSAHRGSSSPE